ncbi:ferritin-like domain-containing protein [soil metagenome]
MKTLDILFLDELADIYDAERRIIKALPKMAKAATSPKLKEAILSHLEETKGHAEKVEQIFECFGKKAKGKTCEATVGLLAEGAEIAVDFKGSPALNAALICALQKVEHYEIATYGCLREWSEMLSNSKATSLLQEILDEEKDANHALTGLARETSNEEAMDDSAEVASASAPVKKSGTAASKRASK